MPSKSNSLQQAHQALDPTRQHFRSALAQTIDEVQALLSEGADDPTQQEGRALGQMARGRINPQRFSALLRSENALSPELRSQIEKAQKTLKEIHQKNFEPYQVRVEPGQTLRDAVGGAYARLGRAFGAARTITRVRTGRFRLEQHGGYLDTFPFRRWNQQERQIAPPLVVQLRGDNLWPGGLSEFLDGNVRIALLVEGPAPAVPLVRLITPTTLVAQHSHPDKLDLLREHPLEDEPAVVALLSSQHPGQGEFIHRPGELTPAQRLTVARQPDPDDLRPIGGATIRQQSRELDQLMELAADTQTVSAVADGRQQDGETTDQPPPESDKAGQLAGWLLRQSGLDELEAS